MKKNLSVLLSAKPIKIFLFVVAVAFSVKGNAQGNAQDWIHQQEAVWQVEDSKSLFADKKGDFILTQDSVIFRCEKKDEIVNLALSYKDIKQVRRCRYLWTSPVALLLGTVVLDYAGKRKTKMKIKMKNGEKYYFFTAKRKKIIKIIKSKIAD